MKTTRSDVGLTVPTLQSRHLAVNPDVHPLSGEAKSPVPRRFRAEQLFNLCSQRCGG